MLHMAGFRELSRTVRDDGTGVRVGEVTLQGPDGVVFRRRYLHTPDVVAVVAVHLGALLLVREFRAAVGVPVLQVPMGKLAAGADPAAHARRELAEETGFQADRCAVVGTLMAGPGWTNQVMYVCRATDLTPLGTRPAGDDPDDVEEQQSTLVRMPVDELDAAMRSGVLADARTIAAVHLALG
jgi:ADP-ribose pyrophosphatase